MMVIELSPGGVQRVRLVGSALAPAARAPAPSGSGNRVAAEQRIQQIRADPSSPYWRGAPGALEEMDRLLRVVSGTTSAPSGVSGPAPAPLVGLDPETGRVVGEVCQAAGVSATVQQSLVDYIRGFREDLPEAAIGVVQTTDREALDALIKAEGLADAARQTLGKGMRVLSVVKSLAPELETRLKTALDGSGLGNAVKMIQQFAGYYDLDREAAIQKVAENFGAKHAATLRQRWPADPPTARR